MSRTEAVHSQGGIPLAEAAIQLGLSVEATRKRAQRGTVPAYKVEDHWSILLDNGDHERARPSRTTPAVVPDTGQDNVRDGGQDPIEARYRVAGESPLPLVPLQTMVEELRGLAGELALLAQRDEALALGVGQLRERTVQQSEQLAAKDETIADLRHRAEEAERERDQLRAGVVHSAPLASPAGAYRAEDASDEWDDPQPLWRRLWWALTRRGDR